MKHVLLTIFILSSLNIMAQLTNREKEIIRSGDAYTPLEVLKVTSKEDSLFLRKIANNVDFNHDKEDLLLLINRLKMTMAVESGVGIAAPQVGIARNIFLFMRMDHPDRTVVAAINPRIVGHSEETICFENDGCLSIPDVSGNTVRYPWIEVEYTNEEGQLVHEKLEGYSRQGNFTGVIFQHEYDHLQGVLFIDKLCHDTEQ